MIKQTCLIGKLILTSFLVFGPYNDWSTCSKTCGDGRKHRTRACISGVCSNVSPDDLIEYAVCNEGPCE